MREGVAGRGSGGVRGEGGVGSNEGGSDGGGRG